MSTLSLSWPQIKQITRLDKPIGSYLLLWPTYWALWIAGQGQPGLHLLLVFSLGVLVMRSAGCVINDFADRKIDGKVARTKNRPLATGQVTPKQALLLFIFLLFVALFLVSSLSWLTIKMSFIALALATLYPFCKRYTHLPQLVLGAAFSWGMIMAFSEITGEVPLLAWLLFASNLIWTVAYDTMYAMVDRDDDIKIGVKSSAILFGQHDKRIIGFLQLLTLALWLTIGEMLAFGWPYQICIVISSAMFCYQQLLIKDRDPQLCFKAFLNNHLVGLIVFTGIFIEYL
jgi:4-hydroxybenzoate polyprenyltransferase